MEGDNFVLVLRRYETSLAQWRASLPADPGPRLQLYLNVFSDVLLAVQVDFFCCCISCPSIAADDAVAYS